MFGSYFQAIIILEHLLKTASDKEAIEIRRCMAAIAEADERSEREFEQHAPLCDDNDWRPY